MKKKIAAFLILLNIGILCFWQKPKSSDAFPITTGSNCVAVTVSFDSLSGGTTVYAPAGQAIKGIFAEAFLTNPGAAANTILIDDFVVPSSRNNISATNCASTTSTFIGPVTNLIAPGIVVYPKMTPTQTVVPTVVINYVTQ